MWTLREFADQVLCPHLDIMKTEGNMTSIWVTYPAPLILARMLGTAQPVLDYLELLCIWCHWRHQAVINVVHVFRNSRLKHDRWLILWVGYGQMAFTSWPSHVYKENQQGVRMRHYRIVGCSSTAKVWALRYSSSLTSTAAPSLH
jgi:hypothetical protein